MVAIRVPAAGPAGHDRVIMLAVSTLATTAGDRDGRDGDGVAAIEAGATGYLLKDAPRGELLRAVRAAVAFAPGVIASTAHG